MITRNKYCSLTDYLFAIAYGGLTEISKNAVDIIFGIAVVVIVIMLIRGEKLSQFFGDEDGKITFKGLAIRGSLLFIGFIIGRLLMICLLRIFHLCW